jgi:hypothetical protein
MKVNTSLSSAPFVLKLVGVLLILSSLIDYTAILIPPNFSDKPWLVDAVAQMVNRGIIPMLGIALLFVGNFLKTGSMANDRGAAPATARFWALLLSLLLGLVFLIAFPVHLNNTRQVSDDALKQIEQRAVSAETQLDQQVKQRQAQITSALKDPQQAKRLDEELARIDEAIAKGQIQGDELLKADPNAVVTRAQEFRSKNLADIQNQRKQAEERARGEFWKTGVRVGLSSLLLSLGYLLIGWFGLREMGVFGSNNRRPPREPRIPIEEQQPLER